MRWDFEREIGKRLIELIFGKMATERFLKEGVPNFMPSEKNDLSSFIEEFLVSKDVQILAEISIFGERQICEIETPIRDSENRANLNENLDKSKQPMNIETNSNRIIEEETQSIPDKSKLYMQVSKEKYYLKQLMNRNVPQKYLNHYKWLIQNMEDRNSIRSFRKLLVKVYLKPVHVSEVNFSLNTKFNR